MRAIAILLMGLGATATTQAAEHFAERARALDDTARLVRTPSAYRAISLEPQALAAVLRGASEQQSVELSLPMPDGENVRFTVYETSNMAPELAAKYPLIKSYRGQLQSSDPHRAHWVSARIDYSPDLGFQAMVFDLGRTILIEPVQFGQGNRYISYDRAHVGRGSFQCGVTGETVTPASKTARSGFWGRAPEAKVTTGTVLRVYRLAIAATGEYTQFFGGTVPAGLAAIVTSMNRVNEVYLREFALRMVLVANNDQVVYTNGATDPYTNDDGVAMLSENTTNLNAVLGSTAYDIGHVYSTGGGGVASLRSPCTSSKARGVTGSSSPTGDPFWIDYVSHEMGHQWGGNHTFNSETGSCAGNRNPTTAYEPGSGSTIQAYAGICGADDLQANSDPWFHAGSVEEMHIFMSGSTGGSCAISALSSGNTPPTANAGVNRNIPARTPFMLTGSGSDPEGRPLLYLFEQYNLGPSSAPGVDNGAGPITRSYVPSSSPVRFVPRLNRILNGGSDIGETLPQGPRANLQFRLTVRDQATNGGLAIGASTSADVSMAVVNTGAPFQITSQNTATAWNVGSTQTVTWDVAGTNVVPIACTQVQIALSTDGGLNFNQMLEATTPNDGTQAITVPSSATTTGRIRVMCADNIFFDINNVNITITQVENIFRNGFE
jgi:hypothetical protein